MAYLQDFLVSLRSWWQQPVRYSPLILAASGPEDVDFLGTTQHVWYYRSRHWLCPVKSGLSGPFSEGGPGGSSTHQGVTEATVQRPADGSGHVEKWQLKTPRQSIFLFFSHFLRLCKATVHTSLSLPPPPEQHVLHTWVHNDKTMLGMATGVENHPRVGMDGLEGIYLDD